MVRYNINLIVDKDKYLKVKEILGNQGFTFTFWLDKMLSLKLKKGNHRDTIDEPEKDHREIYGKCQGNFCNQPATHKDIVKKYNQETGNDVDTEMNLCSKHHSQAKTEERLVNNSE